jgi:hypothetical protein
MTQVEIDKPSDEKPYWTNVPMMQEITRQLKDVEAIGVAVMILAVYAKNGGVPMKGDSVSLVKAIGGYNRRPLPVSRIDKMRPELLRLIFDEDQDGCWTPKPGLMTLDDPYAPEDDDGA